jgi:hypothetical protein
MKNTTDDGAEELLLSVDNTNEDSLDGLLDDMGDALDDFFDQAAAGPDAGDIPADAAPNNGQWGMAEMEGTFLAILRNNLKPVTRYIKALESLRHNPSLYEIIDLTVAPMADMAHRAELEELAGILGRLSDTCREAVRVNGDRSLRKGLKREVLDQYTALAERVEIGFRGHRPAVRNLLRFYNRVRREPDSLQDDIRRIFAVGIPSVSWVSRTPASELISLSGVSHQGIMRIKTLSRQNGRKVGFKNAGVNLDLTRLSKLTDRL